MFKRLSGSHYTQSWVSLLHHLQSQSLRQHSAGKSSPAKSSPGWKQQGDHGVAQALAEGAEELAVLYVIASVQAQSLLPSLLFSLNGIKIPSQLENRGVKIHGLYVSRSASINILSHFSHKQLKTWLSCPKHRQYDFWITLLFKVDLES